MGKYSIRAWLACDRWPENETICCVTKPKTDQGAIFFRFHHGWRLLQESSFGDFRIWHKQSGPHSKQDHWHHQQTRSAHYNLLRYHVSNEKSVGRDVIQKDVIARTFVDKIETALITASRVFNSFQNTLYFLMFKMAYIVWKYFVLFKNHKPARAELLLGCIQRRNFE